MIKVVSQDEFFNNLGISTDNPLRILNDVPCEVCGSTNFSRILNYTEVESSIICPFPISGCNDCGYIMQNPRLSPDFFDYFYKNLYSLRRSLSSKNTEYELVDKSGSINLSSIKNQVLRAKLLYEFLETCPWFEPKLINSVFDVGAGSGGFLKYFADRGIRSVGSDPDPEAVKASQTHLGIQIELACSENYSYSENYDLFTIMGSLEHCQDPNRVLKNIAVASNKNTILVHEGRSFPLSYSFRFLNFNHHRYLFPRSIIPLLRKHGYETILSTDKAVCGNDTGRDGNAFTFSKFILDKLSRESLLEFIHSKNLYVSPAEFIKKMKQHDESLGLADQTQLKGIDLYGT